MGSNGFNTYQKNTWRSQDGCGRLTEIGEEQDIQSIDRKKVSVNEITPFSLEQPEGSDPDEKSHSNAQRITDRLRKTEMKLDKIADIQHLKVSGLIPVHQTEPVPQELKIV